MARRRLSSLLLIALVWSTCALSGCVQEDQHEAAPAVSELKVSGAGATLSLFTLLADAYDSDQVRFTYLQGLHSDGGIQGVATRVLDIGLVSRELRAQEASLGLEYTKLSDDGFVVAVNPSVTLTGLTSQNVRDVFTGSYTNWKELGGPDLGIVILDRNEGESGKMAMRQFFLGPDRQISPSAVLLSSASDMQKALVKTDGAIGYGSLGDFTSSAAPLRMLAIDGVAPSTGAIATGTYKLTRPLGVVVASPPSREIDEFLKWARSPEAAELAVSKGFAPPRNP